MRCQRQAHFTKTNVDVGMVLLRLGKSGDGIHEVDGLRKGFENEGADEMLSVKTPSRS